MVVVVVVARGVWFVVCGAGSMCVRVWMGRLGGVYQVICPADQPGK